MNPRELRRLLQQVGLGAAAMAAPPPGRKAAAAAAAAVAAAEDAWAADTLAGLADGEGMLLNDGTVVGLGSIFIAAKDLSFSTPVEEADQPEFEDLKRDLLLPDSEPEFELQSIPATHQWQGRT